MKVLSVPQPYASLVTAGIYDFMNVTWKPKEESFRILIYANKRKISVRSFIANEITEEFQEVFNHIVFGNIPDFKDMPSGAIIGYATVDRIQKASDDNGISYNWFFEDAHLFDKPITGVNGRPRLWDYEIDENNLPPAHKVKLNNAQLKEDDIYIPLSKSLWAGVGPKRMFTLEFSEDLRMQFEEKDWLPFFGKPNRIHFTHNGEKRSFLLKSLDTETEIDMDDYDLGWYIDEDGIYNSKTGEKEDRNFMTFLVDDEIK